MRFIYILNLIKNDTEEKTKSKISNFFIKNSLNKMYSDDLYMILIINLLVIKLLLIHYTYLLNLMASSESWPFLRISEITTITNTANAQKIMAYTIMSGCVIKYTTIHKNNKNKPIEHNQLIVLISGLSLFIFPGLFRTLFILLLDTIPLYIIS